MEQTVFFIKKVQPRTQSAEEKTLLVGEETHLGYRL